MFQTTHFEGNNNFILEKYWKCLKIQSYRAWNRIRTLYWIFQEKYQHTFFNPKINIHKISLYLNLRNFVLFNQEFSIRNPGSEELTFRKLPGGVRTLIEVWNLRISSQISFFKSRVLMIRIYWLFKCVCVYVRGIYIIIYQIVLKNQNKNIFQHSSKTYLNDLFFRKRFLFIKWYDYFYFLIIISQLKNCITFFLYFKTNFIIFKKPKITLSEFIVG